MCASVLFAVVSSEATAIGVLSNESLQIRVGSETRRLHDMVVISTVITATLGS